VIDDGSTDGSRVEAVAAVAGDPRFRLFAGPNGGLSAARNLGLALARGRFIAFLDGDDRFAPDFLARMVAALQDSGADWVACGLTYVRAGETEGPVHSAIHGAPEMPEDATPRLYDLSDWREVVRHFPSA
jgi:glycosyltransferase involved in cell wall biosynthesis